MGEPFGSLSNNLKFFYKKLLLPNTIRVFYLHKKFEKVANKNAINTSDSDGTKKEERMDWSNKKDVLEAVKKDGMNLQHAHYTLKSNKEVVLEAVKQNTSSLQFAHYSLKEDKDIVKETTKKLNLHGLEFISYKFRDDKDFILKLIQENDNFVLGWASDKLRDDEDVVNAAVGKSIRNLQYASQRLQNKRLEKEGKEDLKIEVGRRIHTIAKYKAEPFSNKQEFLNELKEVKLDSKKEDDFQEKYKIHDSKTNLNYNILDDKEIMLEYLSLFPGEFTFVSDRLKDDEEIVIEAVNQYAWTFRFASERIRDNKEFILNSLKPKGYAENILCYVSERLLDDEDFIKKMIEKFPDFPNDVISLSSERLKNEFEQENIL